MNKTTHRSIHHARSFLAIQLDAITSLTGPNGSHLNAGDQTQPLGMTVMNRVGISLYLTRVPCGFPSPAEDYIEHRLSLDRQLIKNPDATFFVRASGDSMVGAGIHHGDLLVIDRSITAAHRHIVLAIVDNEFTVKRLMKNGSSVFLKAENPMHPDIYFGSEQSMVVWGVVIHVIRHMAP